MLIRVLFLLFFLLKEPHDGVCGINLRGIIQMRIDISCGADVAVPEPFLDVFQRDSIRVKQTGATVTQIVETNSSHPMFLKEVWESCCQIGNNDIPLFRSYTIQMFPMIVFRVDFLCNIRLCFDYDCIVFLVVGTGEEMRKYHSGVARICYSVFKVLIF